jgi:hypothetical protein
VQYYAKTIIKQFLEAPMNKDKGAHDTKRMLWRAAAIIIVSIALLLVALQHDKDAGKIQNTKSDNYNKLIGYGGIIARAKACGIDTEGEQRRVKRWIDQNTIPGSMDNQAFHVTFANMIAFWGTDTDKKDCDSILHEYTEVIPWPE